MDLLTAIKATYEVIGQEISDLAIQVLVTELTAHPAPSVLEALTRCRKELRKITLADILDRLPNGHPGPEEAWAIASKCLGNESVSVVWTDEIALAFGPASALAADPVAARMAFREIYVGLVGQARALNLAPAWRVSLGHDPSGRAVAIQEAIDKGRLSLDHARQFLPECMDHSVTETLPTVRSMP